MWGGGSGRGENKEREKEVGREEGRKKRSWLVGGGKGEIVLFYGSQSHSLSSLPSFVPHRKTIHQGKTAGL